MFANTRSSRIVCMATTELSALSEAFERWYSYVRVGCEAADHLCASTLLIFNIS